METGALARSSPPRLSRGTVLAALSGESTYGYVRLAHVLRAISHSLVQSPPEGSSAADLRALLLECADPAVALASAPVTVPQSLVDDFLAGVERIRANALLAPEAFFSIDNDLLIKDLAVCLGQMFPAGARLIDLQSGLPRKLLLWQGAGMPSALRFFHRAGGFRPWFETHVDPRDLSQFNESGLRRMYLRVAALLDANPQVRGVFGGSWFYDPLLEPISPHLAYLQQFPRQHGAKLLRAMTTAGMIKGALAKSRRRREAYERGHYRPQWYFLAWPRSALLQWARSQPPVTTQPA